MRSMFVELQVAVEGEGWMVRAISKCYYCIYERDIKCKENSEKNPSARWDLNPRPSEFSVLAFNIMLWLFHL